MININKEMQQKQQIAEAVAMIQNAQSKFEHLAKDYVIWIDEAAELGEDDYSN